MPQKKAAQKKEGAAKKEQEKAKEAPQAPSNPLFFDWKMKKTISNGPLEVTLERLAILPYKASYLGKEPQEKGLKEEEVGKTLEGSFLALEMSYKLNGKPIEKGGVESYLEHVVLLNGKRLPILRDQTQQTYWGSSVKRRDWFYMQVRGLKDVPRGVALLTLKAGVKLNGGKELPVEFSGLTPPFEFQVRKKAN